MGDADNADYKESNIEIFDTVDEVKVTAIVLAAGKGSRMHSDIPKQFMTLGDYPVLYYSLKAFQDSPVDDIILVTGEDYVEYCRNDIVDRYNITKVRKIVTGGQSAMTPYIMDLLRRMVRSMYSSMMVRDHA